MLPKELYQENYEATKVALRLVKKTQGRKSSKCLFVDHQTTAKREQNMTVLLENNVSVLAKSDCDLCPLRILFSDEAHFWLNGYVNKQNCRIWSEADPQVYVETPLHPEKLTVWCALWAGGILLRKR
ncbi:hypothetical protein TNCV_1643541 [Trichonephila clavipes]|nr:hypothetical protein TNCV_1643541 [Trichonephila clavipes]